jgi:FkbM family methyltransferase
MLEQKTDDNFWVQFNHHSGPFLEKNFIQTQSAQRNRALKFVKNFNVCLDIGSHVGFWTRTLATRFNTVHCFEPNPTFINCFNMNIKNDNVILHEIGLSNKDHTASQEFNSTVMTHTPGNVQCQPLDSFNLNNIDLIKIDVDGFEVEVLEGAEDTIKRNNAVVVIEMKSYKRPNTCMKVREILSRLNYSSRIRIRSDEIWLKK